MAFPAWLEPLLGATGLACFALMLVPQALLNARRRSTQGMALGAILVWHLAVLLAAAFFLAGALSGAFEAGAPEAGAAMPVEGAGSWVWIATSMGSSVLVCCLIEAQVVSYRKDEAGRWPPPQTWPLARGAVAGGSLLATSALAAVGLGFWMHGARGVMVLVLGNVLPSVLFALGFLPQIYVFVAERTVRGFAFGMVVLDLIGSGANIALCFEPPGISTRDALLASLPFLMIIFMHAILVSVALGVVLSNRLRHPSMDDSRSYNA